MRCRSSVWTWANPQLYMTSCATGVTRNVCIIQQSVVRADPSNIADGRLLDVHPTTREAKMVGTSVSMYRIQRPGRVMPRKSRLHKTARTNHGALDHWNPGTCSKGGTLPPTTSVARVNALRYRYPCTPPPLSSLIPVLPVVLQGRNSKSR